MATSRSDGADPGRRDAEPENPSGADGDDRDEPVDPGSGVTPGRYRAGYESMTATAHPAPGYDVYGGETAEMAIGPDATDVRDRERARGSGRAPAVEAPDVARPDPD